MWSFTYATLSLTLNQEATKFKPVERKYASKHQASRQTEVGGILFSFFPIFSLDVI